MVEVDEGTRGGPAGPHRAVFDGMPQTSTVAEARRWARAVLQAWDADEFEWELSQLLTEVVTNAVLHARTSVRVVLQYDEASGRIRCEVSDGSPVMPRVRRHSIEATTGRGLRLLEQVATTWGTNRVGQGKTVWFEVDGAGDAEVHSDEFADVLAELDGHARTPVDGAEAVAADRAQRAGMPRRALRRMPLAFRPAVPAPAPRTAA